jgi:hypothetical protein
VVALPPAATRIRPAPAPTALRVALACVDQIEPRRRRHLDHGRVAVPDEGESRFDLPPERVVCGGGAPFAAQGLEQNGAGALAAVSGRAEVGGGSGSLHAPANGLGDLARAQRSLEGVGRDKEGRHRRRAYFA